MSRTWPARTSTLWTTCAVAASRPCSTAATATATASVKCLRVSSASAADGSRSGRSRAAKAIRPCSSLAPSGSARRSAGSRGSTISTRSSAPRSPGRSDCCAIRGKVAPTSGARCPALIRFGSRTGAVPESNWPQAMTILRPKSLSSLMLLGLAVIAVPLLVAIVNAALQMRRLADTSRQLVIEGVSTARSTQDLKSQIDSLDRTTRLYQVLTDAKLLDLYREQDAQFDETRINLARHLTSSAAQQSLDELGRLEASIGSALLGGPKDAAKLADLSQRFAELRALADRIAQQSEADIDAQVADIQRRTLAAQRRLFWQSTLLLPLTLVAILVVTLAIGRPLRHIDRAISELGAGNFSHPIAVSGPLDLERLGRQLEWLRARLLDHAHERNRFLRHMSHELKTPLANIREGTELLMDGAVGELDGNQREVAGILRENSIKLQRMIENLLSFSAWQTSSVGLETSEFRLRPLVKQVLENQQLTLLSQRVRLDVKIEDITLVADRGKLRLILDNLLSNAVKYSPKGGTIHIGARAAGSDLVLDVADSGPGIPREDRAHIFDAFYTGRAARGTSVKGTGIGLSVVLEFVSAHGGTVQIIDGQFPGAHFRITMPLVASGARTPPDAAVAQKGQGASSSRDHAHAAWATRGVRIRPSSGRMRQGPARL